MKISLAAGPKDRKSFRSVPNDRKFSRVRGIVADPEESGSLARAIGRFRADRELTARLGEKCKQRLSRFSRESITDAYASLFAEVRAQ